MQASLCLRTAGSSARIQHSPLTLRQAGSVLLHRHIQIALHFSPFFRTGLRARPSRRPFNPTMQAHMTPPEDGIDKKKAEEARRGTVKSVAAAVVLACTLGAMCTNWKARADDRSFLTSWFQSPPSTTTDEAPPSAPPSTTGAATPSTTMLGAPLTKSIKALQEVFELKRGPGTQKPAPAVPKILLDLLDEALPPIQPEWKTYVDQFKKDARINSLYEEWMKKAKEWDKKKQNPSEEDYKIGLVLIDLLIHQGNYDGAKEVCQKVYIAHPRDPRARIRMAVLEMMLLPGELGSGTLQTERESTVQKFIKDITIKEIKIN